jgi:2,3-dihydroxybenzoate decarboxylase
MFIGNGLPMKQNVTFYLKNNIYETSSDNFATDLLQYHILKAGLDRLLYSIDYPWATIEDGTEWVEGLGPTRNKTLNEKDFLAFKRENAIKLLRLND